MDVPGHQDSSSARKRQKVSDTAIIDHTGRRAWQGSSADRFSAPQSQGMDYQGYNRSQSHGADGNAYPRRGSSMYDGDRAYGSSQGYHDWDAQRNSSGWYGEYERGYHSPGWGGANQSYGEYSMQESGNYYRSNSSTHISRAHSDGYGGYGGFYRSNSAERGVRDRGVPSSSGYYHADGYHDSYAYPYDSYRSGYGNNAPVAAEAEARGTYRTSRFGFTSPFRGGGAVAVNGVKSNRYANTFKAKQYSFGARKVNKTPVGAEGGNGQSGKVGKNGDQVNEVKEPEKPKVISDPAVKELLTLRTATLDHYLLLALLKLNLQPDPDLRKTLLEQKIAAQEAERKAAAEAERKAAEEEQARLVAEAAAARKAMLEESKASAAAATVAVAVDSGAQPSSSSSSAQHSDRRNASAEKDSPPSKAVSAVAAKANAEAAGSALEQTTVEVRREKASKRFDEQQLPSDQSGGRAIPASSADSTGKTPNVQRPPLASRETSTGAQRPGTTPAGPAGSANANIPRAPSAHQMRGRSPGRDNVGAGAASAANAASAQQTAAGRRPAGNERGAGAGASRGYGRDERPGADYGRQAYGQYGANDGWYGGYEDDRYAYGGGRYDAYGAQGYYDGYGGYGYEGAGYGGAEYGGGYGGYEGGYGAGSDRGARGGAGMDSRYGGYGAQGGVPESRLSRQSSAGSARGGMRSRSRSPGRQQQHNGTGGGMPRITSTGRLSTTSAGPKEVGEADETSPMRTGGTHQGAPTQQNARGGRTSLEGPLRTSRFN